MFPVEPLVRRSGEEPMTAAKPAPGTDEPLLPLLRRWW